MPMASKQYLTIIFSRILFACLLGFVVVFAAGEILIGAKYTLTCPVQPSAVSKSGIAYKKGIVKYQPKSTSYPMAYLQTVDFPSCQFLSYQQMVEIAHHAEFYSPYTQCFFPLRFISGFSFKRPGAII